MRAYLGEQRCLHSIRTGRTNLGKFDEYTLTRLKYSFGFLLRVDEKAIHQALSCGTSMSA